MKLSKIFRYFIFALIALIISVIFFWDKLPYQSVAEHKVIQFLEAQGFKVNSIKITNISSNSAEISDIDLGDHKHLLIKNLQTKFDLQTLYEQQKIQSLTIDDIQLNAYIEDGKFVLGGVERLSSNRDKSPASFDISNAPEIGRAHV